MLPRPKVAQKLPRTIGTGSNFPAFYEHNLDRPKYKLHGGLSGVGWGRGGLQLDAVFGLQVDGPITGGGGTDAYWGRAEGGAYKRLS